MCQFVGPTSSASPIVWLCIRVTMSCCGLISARNVVRCRNWRHALTASAGSVACAGAKVSAAPALLMVSAPAQAMLLCVRNQLIRGLIPEVLSFRKPCQLKSLLSMHDASQANPLPEIWFAWYPYKSRIQQTGTIWRRRGSASVTGPCR